MKYEYAETVDHWIQNIRPSSRLKSVELHGPFWYRYINIKFASLVVNSSTQRIIQWKRKNSVKIYSIRIYGAWSRPTTIMQWSKHEKLRIIFSQLSDAPERNLRESSYIHIYGHGHTDIYIYIVFWMSATIKTQTLCVSRWLSCTALYCICIE